jgi:1A family penicillin-binding protein
MTLSTDQADNKETPINKDARRKPRSGFSSTLALLSLSIALIGGFVLAGALLGYAWIAVQLPSAEELRVRSHQFATTQILDRNGNLLWEIIDPTGGRRTRVTLDHISPQVIQATLATEDRYFYLNVGVDPIAIIRAVRDNLAEQQIVSGASTITQQLARNVFLPPEEQAETSFSRKIKEAVLAIEISRRYTKNQILETYFNQIYYGNLAYGVEAAAQTYFGKPASALSLPEAAMLAGLPQSPATLDPYLNPDGAKARQAAVLDLMVEAGYISRAEAASAKIAPLDFRDANFAVEVPHFIAFVRQELERNVPPAYLYQAGLRVYTTLDPELQAMAEEEVRNQVNRLADRNVTNGALLALDVATGQILAMVGSYNFWNEQIDGQVNMIVSPRQPASTLKPLTYLAAFEQLNWTPSSLIMDTPVTYPEETGYTYQPHNVDQRFHGPVSVRTALANSYNIPALKALEQIGMDALKGMATRLGITSLTRDDYGLSLALGSGEVSLLEMTGAYQVMANGGLRQPPTAILKITDIAGREIEPIRPQPQQVLRPEHAYLMTHILADNEARIPGFGADSPLHLSRPATAKTGTSNDFRDNWLIGYTPDIVTGVWVGNADNSSMHDVDGASGAGPIWHNFMERAHANRPIRDFIRPETIVEIEVCADSGTLPSDACPQRRTEIFFEEQPPLGPEQDIHQLIEIDLNSGLRANQFCQTNVIQRYYRVYPPDSQEWAIAQGFEQPPSQYCPAGNIVAAFTQPIDGGSMSGLARLEGSATSPDFAYYQLELGRGTNPQTFTVIQGPTREQVKYDLLGVLDTRQLENGPYTLKLKVANQGSGFREIQIRVAVENPDYAIVVQTPVTTPPAALTPVVTTTLIITDALGFTTTLVLTTPVTATGTPEPVFLPGELTNGLITASLTIPPQTVGP